MCLYDLVLSRGCVGRRGLAKEEKFSAHTFVLGGIITLHGTASWAADAILQFHTGSSMPGEDNESIQAEMGGVVTRAPFMNVENITMKNRFSPRAFLFGTNPRIFLREGNSVGSLQQSPTSARGGNSVEASGILQARNPNSFSAFSFRIRRRTSSRMGILSKSASQRSGVIRG
jgi:hypothetical protein